MYRLQLALRDRCRPGSDQFNPIVADRVMRGGDHQPATRFQMIGGKIDFLGAALADVGDVRPG